MELPDDELALAKRMVQSCGGMVLLDVDDESSEYASGQ